MCTLDRKRRSCALATIVCAIVLVGTLGGKYTTVEGLVRDMYEQLAGARVEAEQARGSALEKVLERLSAMLTLSSTGRLLLILSISHANTCTCKLYSFGYL